MCPSCVLRSESGLRTQESGLVKVPLGTFAPVTNPGTVYTPRGHHHVDALSCHSNDF